MTCGFSFLLGLFQARQAEGIRGQRYISEVNVMQDCLIAFLSFEYQAQVAGSACPGILTSLQWGTREPVRS